jgi:hypothetical protein
MDDGEAPSIDGRDVIGLEPLGGSDDRGVHCAERQVAVLRHEFGDAHPVGRRDWFNDQIASGEITQETHLGVDAESRAEQVGHLGDHEGGHDQGPRVRFEQIEACGVVAVVSVDVGVQRAGVDDQCDEPTSLASISSMRSEMSARPLAPAPEARSRRLPRGAASSVSIASRVSADTVIPRRWASCRSRASRSSGSLTVVRRMYASIPKAARDARQRWAASRVFFSILRIRAWESQQPRQDDALFGSGVVVVSG